MNGKRRRHWAAYGMILPSYLIYFIFTLLPLGCTIAFSFTNFDGFRTMDFIGLSNYHKLLRDQIYLKSVYNTAVYALFTIIPPIVLGLLVAVQVNEKLLFNRFVRSAFYMPYVVSMVAASTIWYWMFDPMNGLFNIVLQRFGFQPRDWLFQADTAMACVIVMSIWKVLGYNMIVYLSGLQGIPAELYEAAKIDGAGGVQRFLHITVPLLRSTTFFLFVMSCISSLNVFEQVSVLTGGGPANATTTIVHQLYKAAFEEYRMGYASSMAVVLVLVTMIITLLNFRYGNAADAADL